MPRNEAVSVFGQPVLVDYFDKRKFAAAVRRQGGSLDLRFMIAFADLWIPFGRFKRRGVKREKDSFLNPGLLGLPLVAIYSPAVRQF